MQTSPNALRKDVTKAEAFFTRPEQVDHLPFVHGFPKNSCELVTALLAVAIKHRYLQASVEVISAHSTSTTEQHFWLEVDGIVVDATAHQFDHFNEPIICPRPSPLEAQFPELERLTPDEAIGRLDFLSAQVKQSVLSALEKEIAA